MMDLNAGERQMALNEVDRNVYFRIRFDLKNEIAQIVRNKF